VQQILLKRAVSQIAARLVNTNEAIEVYLARGKLDDYNKAAEAGLWNRALESWETMTPLPNKEDDSYRLYNIGVAYEALAYKAEDMKTTKKFFDQAAISYGKAIDANPGEKYFLDPQDRIQTALAHYKKLETQAAAPAAAPAPAPPPPVVVAAPAKPAPKAPKVATTTATATPPPPTAPKSNGATLTNAKLIQLVKAGLDEENLAATIRDAPSVNFDLSPDGQLFLLQGGLRPRLITVMREKMKGAPRPAAPASKTNTAQNK
jgi:tetratricopeptide (TPR) repeat protein